jgi:molecular chaperone GrpE (heat shock protein)
MGAASKAVWRYRKHRRRHRCCKGKSMSDPDKHYWSDEYVEKLHAEIAALREKVDSLRSESDVWQETARQFKISYEAAEAKLQEYQANRTAQEILKCLDTLRIASLVLKDGRTIRQAYDDATCVPLS